MSRRYPSSRRFAPHPAGYRAGRCRPAHAELRVRSSQARYAGCAASESVYAATAVSSTARRPGPRGESGCQPSISRQRSGAPASRRVTSPAHRAERGLAQRHRLAGLHQVDAAADVGLVHLAGGEAGAGAGGGEAVAEAAVAGRGDPLLVAQVGQAHLVPRRPAGGPPAAAPAPGRPPPPARSARTRPTGWRRRRRRPARSPAGRRRPAAPARRPTRTRTW